ncbi:hypothetical protein SAMN05444391_1093 [Thermocrinis minervae]|uniref:Uncharacterized protein n=1 Tax=Thermocrinis minervae TaxID=381751 RepID=A0A1M6SN27_9AQUI|nr:hypothetical protein SAMN05444391_1093 [Thermocrinis minervae]
MPDPFISLTFNSTRKIRNTFQVEFSFAPPIPFNSTRKIRNVRLSNACDFQMRTFNSTRKIRNQLQDIKSAAVLLKLSTPPGRLETSTLPIYLLYTLQRFCQGGTPLKLRCISGNRQWARRTLKNATFTLLKSLSIKL